ncbi:TraR/DksA family transcriptional regulator [Streptomyces fungicidicus]|uniref:TraR/DksA family transcriptional regulator n=1 Tax=Streptomyces fungicidicus TaxID=68203 RepID=UPI0013CEEBCC|nr:TraR/DksA C4-type zinc finger protein [Streptomyces fungicidicus]
MVAKKTAVQHSARSGTPGTASAGGAGQGSARSAATRAASGGHPADPDPTTANPAVKKPAAAKRTRKTAPAGEAAPHDETPASTPPGKAPARKTTTKRTPAKKAAARKAATGRASAGKAAGRAAGEAGDGAVGAGGAPQDVAGRSAADDADAADAAAQTGVTTVGAKKTPGTATAAKNAVPKARIGAAEPGELAVRPGEEPWTTEEVEEARAELMSEVLRLGEEITSSEQSLAGLMRDSGDGAGDDDADTGTKNITREHELALAANAREMLTQSERALQRLDAGTYGLCENCGNPIGKARMQAFPRATLCVECKQKQERRY